MSFKNHQIIASYLRIISLCKFILLKSFSSTVANLIFRNLLALAMVFSVAVGILSIAPVTLTTPADIVIKKVSEPVTIDGRATELFWEKAQAIEFPLEATMEGGGHINEVTMKVVNDGSNIYLLFQWSDPTESRIKGGDTKANEDRLAVMVSLDPGEPEMPYPRHQIGTHGAAEAGKYDMWHWKAARTDSEGANFSAVTREGITYTFDHPYSFALDEFGNTTERYREGLTEYVEKDPNHPLAKYNEYDVKAKGIWANSEWTLEMARKYTTTDPDYADKQFKQGENFYFAIAVYDGGEGEDLAVKSVTPWHAAQLSDESLIPAARPVYIFYAAGAVMVVLAAIGAIFVLRRRRVPS